MLRGVQRAPVQRGFDHVGPKLDRGFFVVVTELGLQLQNFVQRADRAFHPGRDHGFLAAQRRQKNLAVVHAAQHLVVAGKRGRGGQ
ncbi:MAG: hypothetical protein ABI256_09290 [Rhodoferax sp.]